MEIGGLMAEAFRTFLGNPDIMAVLVTFIVFSTLLLSVMELSNRTKN